MGEARKRGVFMKNKAHILMGLSAVAVILAAVDFVAKMNILNLAGTQWILIAILLAAWGNHAENCSGCGNKQ